MGANVNGRERTRILTDSAVSDQNPNNVLCILDGVLWNGNDLEKIFIAVFSAD